MGLLTALLPGLLGAALAGALLAAVLWAGGLGWLALLRRGEEGLWVCAYPLGLLGVVLAAWCWLVAPWLGVAALLVLFAPLGLRVARAAVAEAAGVAGRPALLVLPFATVFGVVLGLYYHGPTASRDSHAFGDVVWWVMRAVSARRSPAHLPDLAAAGHNVPVPESGAAFLSGALTDALHVDPFFVYTTALPVCLLLSVAIGLRLLRREGGSGAGALALALLLVGGTLYATWLAESPPVALAIPLALAVYELTRVRVRLATFLALAAVIGIDVVETKIIATVSLACVLGWVLVTRHRASLRRHALAVVAVTAATVLAGALVLVKSASWTLHVGLSLRFTPADIPSGINTFLSQGHQLAALQLPLVVGAQLLLFAQSVRTRATVALLALVPGVLSSWIVGGQNFGIAARLAMVVAALVLLWEREPDRTGLVLLLGAGAALALAATVGDSAELTTSAALVPLLAAALAVATLGRRGLAAAAGVALATGALALAGHGVAAVGLGLVLGALAAVALALPRAQRALVAALALALALILPLAARAVHRHTAGLGTYDETILPREYYDVWREVAHVVPAHGLVFVSQTGEDSSAEAGWNYYPALAGRQVFVAGWVYSQLAVDAALRAQRLEANTAVLKGELAPASLPEAAPYERYFAVLWKNEAHPRTFRMLYDNRLFVLYAVPRTAHSTQLVTSFRCPTYTTCRPR